MERLYSGNLNDFKAACNRLYQLDFAVICDDWYIACKRLECIRLHVEDRSGNLINKKTFCHQDKDVLYNTCTEWLNRMYNQLKDWK